MTINNFTIINDFLSDVDTHIDNIFSNDFIDIEGFKGIQLREDIVGDTILSLFPDYEIAYNFARLSPEGQVEPNYIHSDEMMGELTCVLYLSKEHPEYDGTTFLDKNNDTQLVVRSKCNRMIIFPSVISHCRNIFSNFGSGKKSRLIQVLFLNKKK
jgi:hypothetical protein